MAGINSGGVINFVSWNVRGLNALIKRNKVLSHLEDLHTHIAFLQETHLRPSEHKRIHRRWVGHLFHSKFSCRSRGVAVLINKNVQFTPGSVQSDMAGRYIIVTGHLYQTPVVLVNIYAPNWDDSRFIGKIISLLPDLNSHYLIMGGDFNCAMDPDLDRSSKKQISHSSLRQALNSFLVSHGHSDVWRFFNPNSRQYSFFSPVHLSYSRIDYFFIDDALLSRVKACSYGSIVVSDHATLSMTLFFPDKPYTPKFWRFNSTLLSDSTFIQHLTVNIQVFFSINNSTEVSPSTIWETFKAVIRGCTISYMSFQNKQRREKLLKLTNEIQHLDTLCAHSPDPNTFQKRTALQSEFNLLSTHHIEQMLLRSRQSFFEHGDKPSKILASQLKQQSTRNFIRQIRVQDGSLTTDPLEINNCFKHFYSSLYESDSIPDLEQMENFFKGLPIKTIKVSDAAKLELPITKEEIISAIQAMQSGKTPGPDGFSTEFFKKFSSELAPALLEMFNDSLERGILPTTLRQATISLILKKDKDPLDCGAYRPISLLNVDVKILSKVLAKRLETVLGSIVHTDQTGFVSHRLSFFNIRRVMNILYTSVPSPPSEILLLLDAEKAFDRVEWNYIFYTLQKFGFGPVYISWIKLLYTSPLASVRTNGFCSSFFSLKRGTRQGDPLSPLIFAIAIEPLAIAIRTDTGIHGINRGGLEHKISLYADDVALFLTEPEASLAQVLHVINIYSSFSGYKLNTTKSELFPINISANELPLSASPFRIISHSFKYLGITLTRRYSDLFKYNFLSLLSQVKDDLSHWSSLPLSLIGRVNSVKMNVLPKFLYLFQSIPLFLPKSFFRIIDQCIVSFIWNKKPPKIRNVVIQSPKQLGGLASPNFLFYYWAANIRSILFWCEGHFGLSDWVPAWTAVEIDCARPISLVALLCAPLASIVNRSFTNPVINASLRIWRQFRLHFGLQSPSANMPVTANPLFPPSTMDSAFLFWHKVGIKKICDLYDDGIFCSFTQVCIKFPLLKSHFFRFLQIRNYVRNAFTDFPNMPSKTPLDDILEIDANARSIISKIYSLLFALAPTHRSLIKQQWEQELQLTFEEDDWDKIIHRIHSSSICARHNLIQLKLVYRVYWTKVKLSKINPNLDPLCDRCSQAPATLFHMFWLCPALKSYWHSIFSCFSFILNLRIEPCPLVALFGLTPKDSTVSTAYSDVLAFCTLLARRLILIHWKSSTPPSFDRWLNDVALFLYLEKIRHTLKGNTRQYSRIWAPFFSFFSQFKQSEVPGGSQQT